MKLKKDILFIIVLFLIFSFVWIGESVHRVINNSTISESENQEILSIDPKIDTSTIDMLKSRQQVTPYLELDGTTCSSCGNSESTSISSEEEAPAQIEEESPAPSEEEAPAQIEEESPAPSEEEAPAQVEEEIPAE